MSVFLSVVIPFYNESSKAKAAVRETLSCLKGLGFRFELVAVDDGSTDGTAGILREEAAKTDMMRVLSTPVNRGKGHAVRTGMLDAKGEFLLFFDADLAVPLETISETLALLRDSGADIAIGTRKTPAAVIVKKQPRFREFLGKGFTALTNIMLGTSHSDITCGFKLFRAEAAKKLFAAQRIERWGFDSEILFLAKKMKFKVAEIPVRWKDNPNTKVHVLRDIINSFTELVRIRLLHG